jgi:hypothetical protein
VIVRWGLAELLGVLCMIASTARGRMPRTRAYGLLHGTMNAVSLPVALRFNSIAAGGDLAPFGEAIGGGDPVARVSELAALAVPRGCATTSAQGGPARTGGGDRGVPGSEGEATPGAAGRTARAAGGDLVTGTGRDERERTDFSSPASAARRARKA